jgi:hypothetical protein
VCRSIVLLRMKQRKGSKRQWRSGRALGQGVGLWSSVGTAKDVRDTGLRCAGLKSGRFCEAKRGTTQGGSAVDAGSFCQGIRCVLIHRTGIWIASSRRLIWTTSNRIARTTTCSGMRRTGKDCVTVATHTRRRLKTEDSDAKCCTHMALRDGGGGRVKSFGPTLPQTVP